jgi:hypothetical protein
MPRVVATTPKQYAVAKAKPAAAEGVSTREATVVVAVAATVPLMRVAVVPAAAVAVPAILNAGERHSAQWRRSKVTTVT